MDVALVWLLEPLYLHARAHTGTGDRTFLVKRYLQMSGSLSLHLCLWHVNLKPRAICTRKKLFHSTGYPTYFSYSFHSLNDYILSSFQTDDMLSNL